MPFQNLYIHVPFCAHKCDYCAFYSTIASTPADWDCWLDGVMRGIERNKSDLQMLNSVYFGGGTPTLPHVHFLERMYERIFSAIGLAANAEVSTEANPETLTAEKTKLLAKYMNRVSLGVQSFSREKRCAMGRYPEPADSVYSAVEALHSASVENFGFDLIYAVRGESQDTWMQDLRRAVELHPKHVSAYSMTPEEGTPYASKCNPESADGDLSADMGHAAESFLASSGYEKYEVSNFALPGYSCKYNNGVWHGETYLGLGPSATSFDGTDRWTEQPSLCDWLKGAPATIDHISRRHRLEEMLMMGLRTTAGWSRIEFESAANGQTWDFAVDKFLDLQKRGLLVFTGDECRATPRGLDFWDDIAEYLLSEN